ncbi:hypothetical protein EWM64_g7611 [Hericium alpestre]|uniref:Fungal-type protein kinase domain-containing protein n=1 Tax=Hericium alpestre TaxID=135208 RepID=A0A4Y9ZQU8_9AGAM|nr:hypothetical protein EWM64_g7611 [Hericium alpestre]
MAKEFSQPNIGVKRFLGSLVDLSELTDGKVDDFRSNANYQARNANEAFRQIYEDACAYLQKYLNGLYQSKNTPYIVNLGPEQSSATTRVDPSKLVVPLVRGPESLNLKELHAYDHEVERLDHYLMDRYFFLGLCRFAIGIVTAGPYLSLCYFDHTRYIKTEPFDVFKERGLFLCVVATIFQLCNEDLGREEFITVNPNPLQPSLILRLPGDSTRNQHDKLIGHNIELNLTTRSPSYWPIFRRGPVSLQGLADNITHDLVVELAWYNGMEINGLRTILGQDSIHRDSRCHYPELEFAFTIHVKLPGESMEQRELDTNTVLHITGYRIPKEFKGLEWIKTGQDFRSVFVDLVRRHYEAHRTAGILYKGINAEALGFRKRDDGKLVGFLNDWSQSGEDNSERKGASSFWAIELLNDRPPLHKYRHDLESFFYLLLWFIGYQQDPNDNFFKRMPSGTYVGKQKWKLDFLKNESVKMKETLVEKLDPEFFAIVDDWILPLAKLLRKAYNGFEKDETGEELRDAWITYDNFMKILEGGSASAQSG